MTTQDEKAFFLMDELFDGRARTLTEVKREFRSRGIPDPEYYLREYGISVTRHEVPGTDDRWAYKGPTQLERVRHDAKAGELISRIMQSDSFQRHGFIPGSSFNAWNGPRNRRFKQAIDRALRDMGYYVVDGGWIGTRQVIPGQIYYCGHELSLEDRNWIFSEIEGVAELSPGSIDGESLWSIYSWCWELRVRKVEFMRCVEFVNMYQTFDTKEIFGVGSSYGKG